MSNNHVAHREVFDDMIDKFKLPKRKTWKCDVCGKKCKESDYARYFQEHKDEGVGSVIVYDAVLCSQECWDHLITKVLTGWMGW